MQLEAVLPSPALADFVEYYGLWEEEVQPGAPALAPVLPGVPNSLHVLYGHPPSTVALAAASEQPAPATPLGLFTWPQLCLLPRGRVGIVGIHFRPAGFFHLFGVPLPEAPASALEVGEGARQFICELLRRIGAAATNTERLAVADELLLCHLRSQQPVPTTIDCVADRILHQHGQVSIETLAHDAGLSRRQLERRFLTEVGHPPKLYARLARFHHVLQLLAASPAPSWQDIAYRCGYYDQAHFIREFRFFAGKSPSNYSLIDNRFAHFFWAR